MASKATTDDPRAEILDAGPTTAPEAAPSRLRAEEPRFARTAGMVGLMLVVIGAFAITMSLAGRPGLIGLGRGTFCLVVGLAGLLLHAASDPDLQFRRMYGGFGFVWMGAGVLLALIPYQGVVGGLFLPAAVCFAIALLFLLASLRQETAGPWRDRVVAFLGAAGGAMALIGFLGSNIRMGEFLLPQGLLLGLLGLLYLSAFVAVRGTSEDLAYRVGAGVGLLGALVFLIALGRSSLPPLFFSWRWLSTPPAAYLVPTGLLLMGLGLLYVCVAAGLCSDRPLVVQTRRELAAFFYSPIAYIVLFGFTLVAWFFFIQFLQQLTPGPEEDGQLVEPVIRHYVFGLFPVICMTFIVPVLTMRLLSEEQRTGTLEVLLTAPVNETTVVLSKFLAALAFLLVVWVPWGLFLIALRVEGGQPFDYRPMLSFFIALTFMGAGFMAMGLFFSSLTRNQIASAILTFAAMLLLLGLAIVKWNIEARTPTSPWATILGHVSYVELWYRSLEGALVPRLLLFQASFAVFWLFLTVKVLEIRRWS